MYYSTLPIILSLLPFALGQYGDDSPSTIASSAAPSTTASSVAGVHIVAVGQTGLAFSPNSITAAVGDTVEFQFYPEKHSVAQSSFAAPCTPFSNGTSFFSGSMSTTSGVNANTFQLKINDSSPIWFYCAYPGHCEGGMAGVINPPENSATTIDAYIAAAMNVSSTVAPATVQGGVIGAAIAASSSSSSTTSSTSSSSTSSSAIKNAGIETRGAIRWMLLGFTGAVAVGVGSLML